MMMMGSWILHSIGHLGDGRMWMAKHPMVTEPSSLQYPESTLPY